MARNPLPSLRWRLPLTLALVALLAAAIIPAFAQGGQPTEPLLPNDEPAAAALAEEAPIWTLDERAAVEATLAAYFVSGQTAAPDGAHFDAADLAAMTDAELSAVVTRVYLPLVRKPNELGQLPPTPTPVTPTPVTPTPVTPVPDPGDPADVVVTVWPKPSIIVGRGAVLEYEIRLRNVGKGSADQTVVVLPLNGSQVTPIRTSLDAAAGDWVSDRTPSRFTVIFGRLGAGKTRTGKIFVQVGGALPNQTVLDVRGSYTWRDGVDGGGQRANWTPVLVGNGPADAPYVWVQIGPERGPAGTIHGFFTNRFLPGEVITTWLNTPQGVRPLTLRGTANADGAVLLNFASTGLARGTYQMVLYGNRSGLTGVATFVVQ